MVDTLYLQHQRDGLYIVQINNPHFPAKRGIESLYLEGFADIQRRICAYPNITLEFVNDAPALQVGEILAYQFEQRALDAKRRVIETAMTT